MGRPSRVAQRGPTPPLTQEDYRKALFLGLPFDAPFDLDEGLKDEVLIELGFKKPEEEQP